MSPTSLTAEQIKASIRNTYEIANRRNQAEILEWYDKNFAPNVVVHNLAMGTEIKGLEAFKKVLNFTAFPDFHYTVEDIIVEGDKAFVRRTYTGTHKGNLAAASGASNVVPTGKRITMVQFSVVRYEGGKVAEEWNLTNRLNLYQQLGINPTADMR